MRVILRLVMFLLFVSVFVGAPQLAAAELKDGDAIPSTIDHGRNTPAELTRCQLSKSVQYVGGNGTTGTLIALNRTRHQMTDISVTLTAYDIEGQKMDVKTESLTSPEVVAPGDTAPYKIYVQFNYSGQERFFARVTCKLHGATFSGQNQPWTTGRKWIEPLLPMSRSEARTTQDAQKTRASDLNLTAPPLVNSITVDKIGGAWLDVTSDGAFIHARVQLSASVPRTIRASDLQLAVKLESGVTMQFPGIDRQAPVSDKPFTSGATPSPQVKPQEDFGALGVITLQAKTPVLLIATFAVPSAIISGTFDMQAVSMRR